MKRAAQETYLLIAELLKMAENHLANQQVQLQRCNGRFYRVVSTESSETRTNQRCRDIGPAALELSLSGGPVSTVDPFGAEPPEDVEGQKVLALAS